MKRRCPSVGVLSAETRMRVEDRQQRQADARLRRRRGDPLRHLADVGVGPAVAVVMQIVELADARETRLQHLGIELRGAPPRPGPASSTGRSGTSPRATTRNCRRRGRASRPAPPCRAGRRGCAGWALPGSRMAARSSPALALRAGLDRNDPPAGGFDPHAARPTRRQQCGLGKQCACAFLDGPCFREPPNGSATSPAWLPAGARTA